MSTTPEYLDPDKWAAVLGLIDSLDPSLQALTEQQRIAIFNHRLYVPVNQHLKSGPQATIEHVSFAVHFTAKYLHLLIDRLINLPLQSGDIIAKDHPLENIYHIAFKFTDPNYIGKYMVSDHPTAEGGRQIASVMADRLIDVASTVNDLQNIRAPFSELQKFELVIDRTLGTLTMLIIAKKRNTLSATMSSTLTGILNTWSTRTPWDREPNNFSMRSSMVLSGILNADSIGLQALMRERRRSLGGRDSCALPSCQIEQGLKTCQRSL
ncbi:hypothetical protein FIBSPDRAFT_1055648 [Athelia psychrophila]|uniref:Uncharacterized protein n=1 Tax=Athelia psychrophila TaxID=1759441 RepID=A0A167TCD8_9AGAM|nr:hypothetical protein FIBSPDRAFT_1055648 [Fibularhizoctonia sp. CBS 109695]